MKLTVKSGVAFLISLPLLLSQSGCVTPALWDNEQLEAYKEPAPDPHLHLYSAGPGEDVLVVYDEYSERRNTTRPRAYWLSRNETRVKDNHKPHFARNIVMNGAIEVPVFYNLPNTNYPGFYALGTTNGQFFELYSENREVGMYPLPIYKDKQGTVEKIALTPFTLTVDISIAALYVWLLAHSND